MRILLATTELDRLTGASRMGEEVRSLAGDLHGCPDAEAVVAMPAFRRVIEMHDLIDTGTVIELPDGGGAARALEFRDEDGRQTLLLDAPGLRDAFPRGIREAHDVASQALLWARFLVELALRLEPQIHLCHLFGWQQALVLPLIHCRGLPFRTVLTPMPGAGEGPPLSEVRQSVEQAGLTPLTELLENATGPNTLLEFASAYADHVAPLPPAPAGASRHQGSTAQVGAPEPPGDLGDRRREARFALETQMGLASPAPGESLPLLCVFASSAQHLAPLLDRLLALSIILAVESGFSPAECHRVLATARLRFPRKFCCIKPRGDDREHRRALLRAADLMLLLPPDADAGGSDHLILDALQSGCIPVVPFRDHFRSALSIASDGEPTGCSADRRAVFYRGTSPASIWGALKRAVQLSRDPDHIRERLDAAEVALGSSESWRTLPRYQEIYRQVAETCLTGGAPVSVSS